MNKTNAKNNREQHRIAKEEYLDKRLEYQKLIREKRKLYKSETQKKLVDSRKDSKQFWAEIRKLTFKKHKLANIGINSWGDHFVSKF